MVLTYTCTESGWAAVDSAAAVAAAVGVSVSADVDVDGAVADVADAVAMVAAVAVGGARSIREVAAWMA